MRASDDAVPLRRCDQERIRRAVREILAAVGENPDREGLLETPDRVARMYAEIFSGLHADPAVHLQKTFTQKHDEMVLVKDIEFASCCEHHLLPFTGQGPHRVPAERARSSGCRSWPAWSMRSRSGRRCRSG